MKLKIIYEDWEENKWEEEINDFIKDKKIYKIDFKDHKVFIMYEEEYEL